MGALEGPPATSSGARIVATVEASSAPVLQTSLELPPRRAIEDSSPAPVPAAAPAPAIIEAKPGTPLVTPAAFAPLWGKVIRTQGISPILRAILTNSSLVSLEGGKATVVCAAKFAAGAPKWAPHITELLSREHGSPVEVAIRAAASGETIEAPVPETIAGAHGVGAEASPGAVAPTAPPAAPRVNVVQAADHPLVKQAIELFGGRVVDVQPRRHG